MEAFLTRLAQTRRKDGDEGGRRKVATMTTTRAADPGEDEQIACSGADCGTSSEEWRSALVELAMALEAALPLFAAVEADEGDTKETRTLSEGERKSSPGGGDGGSGVSAKWLLDLCRSPELQAATMLDPLYLAKSIAEVANLHCGGGDSGEEDAAAAAAAQSALFDILGAANDASLNLLLEVTPHLREIREKISVQELDRMMDSSTDYSAINNETSFVDLEEERRQLLVLEALDAAQVAALAQAEVDAIFMASSSRSGDVGGVNSGGGTTHVIQRASDRRAIKSAEKAAERARKALQRARDAGAILDDADLLSVDRSSLSLGSGGMMNRSPEEVAALQHALLPEGSRQYYGDRGLPRGTIYSTDADGTQRVIVPPAVQDESTLMRRLVIKDVMDPEIAKAFAGTTSLNPMQSAVFETAFHSRDNVLVCAPTGAGKTNVALLSATAHFRDVGLIGKSRMQVEAGGKVVYIAPMKALAQEVVEKFSSKLHPLGFIVRELTGDMQLTRAEAAAAHVLVTTPEKWDVVTRKSGTDETSLGAQCGLLIIDEVHLLADERGAVIESVVARVQRFVETRQRQVRIVALSATLPNYDDVAAFLQVPDRGVFFFGPEHRPVPLQQQFIGVNVSSRDRAAKDKKMDSVCFETVLDSLRRGYQVMVFVHSRKGTGDTAQALATLAAENDVLERHFVTQGKDGPLGEAHKRYADRVKKSRNREVQAHFGNGLGIHHAGMLRVDRKLVESMFSDGAIRVLCCTATLAWGVNLPAHSIVIKGTDVYNPEKGAITDLSILDVQQIFGRAGRPQFDTSGEATMITTMEAFPRYMDKLVRAIPIESNFTKQLSDHLNAEIAGGSVANIREAATWLTYTYLYVRMLRNPLSYGISADKKADDPSLRTHCADLVSSAAKVLHREMMIRYDVESGNLASTEIGRIAANFYVQAESVSTFKEVLSRPYLTDSKLLRLVASAAEFKQMKLRQEEIQELEEFVKNDEVTPLKIRGAGMDNAGHSLLTDSIDKVFVLIQVYLSRANIKSFTLMSDVNYIASNASRVARALFEMYLDQKRPGPALKLLRIAKSIDRRIWWFQTPLRHFDQELKPHILFSLEKTINNSGSYDAFASVLSLLEMQPREVGQLCGAFKEGAKIQGFIRMLPKLEVTCKVLPITSDVVRMHVTLIPCFSWHGRWHGGAQSFWFWVENESEILHHEHFILTKRTYSDSLILDFAIPTFHKDSIKFIVRVVSDTWVGVEEALPLSYEDNKKTSRRQESFTSLQDLTPLPVSALHDPTYENLYRFETFNPIQTQLFHVLYHTDSPVLLGAPTGSGKTLIAELALMRMKRLASHGICVYIAPLKALARERLKEWQCKFGQSPLRWRVLELSGETRHDKNALEKADVLVCTPEKWDLISRGWRSSCDAQDDNSLGHTGERLLHKVRLLVLDEVHLLGEERGAVLEAIVSRTRFISRFLLQKQKLSEDKNSVEPTRIVALSTALANAEDLADWIGIDRNANAGTMRGLYNFRNSVRPVEIKVHSQGFSGRHYCPRMATMNKPCLAAIKEHSPEKPALIFVASRRQTRLTAFDLISYAAADDESKRFLRCSEAKIDQIVEAIHDDALRHTIAFGIGLHHAGLSSSDREIVERLFLEGDIQVLVATATLAWGVNLPAHLVIVKGTEYFDGRSSRYVQYPLTDVLQMIGRAGRPGFDTSAHAVVMSTVEMKPFYQKFLHVSFPVESCLQARICENLNAEISCGTVASLVDVVGYLSWTFFARRVRSNPSYYGAKSSEDQDVEDFFVSVATDALRKLKDSGCIGFDEGDNPTIVPLSLGVASSTYYLMFATPKQMEFGARVANKLILQVLEREGSGEKHLTTEQSPFWRPSRVDEVLAAWILYTLCSTHEFDEHPVRHNEEYMNEELSHKLKWGPDTSSLISNGDPSRYNPAVFQDPHTKCFLLIQAFLERVTLPISDYVNDTKTVMENVPRLLAAFHFVARNQEKDSAGTLELITHFSRTRQLLETKSMADCDPLLQLPRMTNAMVQRLRNASRKASAGGGGGVDSLYGLRSLSRADAATLLRGLHTQTPSRQSLDETLDTLYSLPKVLVKRSVVRRTVDERTGKVLGGLHLELNVELLSVRFKGSQVVSRRFGANDDGDGAPSAPSSEAPLTLTILVGTELQGFLLAYKSVTIRGGGNIDSGRSISLELTFDWSVAANHARGGQSGGSLVLRLLWEEVRGLDSQMLVRMNDPAGGS